MIQCRKSNPISFKIFCVFIHAKDKILKIYRNYLNIDLNPMVTTDANSAAYPSGHTIDFLVIIYNFIKIKPSTKNSLLRLYEKIRNVRQLSGVHYPSDTKCSEILFKKMLEHNII